VADTCHSRLLSEAGMIRSKAVKDTRKKILRAAEDLAHEKSEDAFLEDLARTGVVWAGMLELENPIAPSEVAALMCAHDLIRATRLVDSEDYWISAATYAALGAHAEPQKEEAKSQEKADEEQTKSAIGFVASPKSHE
jgi:hypothetical protein